MIRFTRCLFSLILLMLLGVGYLYLRYPATMRNVYEDSWWCEATGRSHYTAWPTFDSNRERLYSIEQLADERCWDEVLTEATSLMRDLATSSDDDERMLAVVAMRYAMLAESCKGTLATNFMRYTLRTPEDFVMFRVRTRDACLFNMYFFRELGLPDEVFHQAMEYPLAFTSCTHRSMRMMTEAAVASGDTAVARKLMAIVATRSDEACGIAASSGDVQTASSGTDDANSIQFGQQVGDLRSRIFVFGDPMVRLFLNLLNDDPTNRRLLDYAALSLIVMGERDRCHQLLRMCPIYNDYNLPPIYR